MTHPLTDEMCTEIQMKFHACPDNWHYEDMRAAADWQLEECIEELNALLYILELAGKIEEADSLEMLNVFKRNLRPLEDNS